MDPFIQNYNQLTGKMLTYFSGKSKHANIVFSPFSVITLMALAGDATAGETRREINRVLDKDLEMNELVDFLKHMQDRFNEERQLISANCIFTKPELWGDINNDFKHHFREKFDGELFMADDHLSEVNQWVSNRTRGMIDRIADGFDNQQLFGIGNAVAFEAEWANQYNDKDVIKRNFTNADGNISKIRMLESKEMLYIEDGQWRGFVKPYQEGRFTFMALLPRNLTLDLSGKNIGNIDFSDLFRNKTYERVNVQMPEFTICFGANMNDFLMSTGIKYLFSEKADFTPFAARQLKGTDVIHKAYIEVDRRGTKAAAATFMFGGGCVEIELCKEVVLDRPFVYAIVDDKTGLPIFAGIVNCLDTISEGENMT